jgi:hypothetical protein
MPQKETLDKAAYTCLLVSYRRLSAQFQLSLSAETLGYLSQWFSHVCDQLLWINGYSCTVYNVQCTPAFLLWGGPNTHPLNLFQYLLFQYCIIYSLIINDIGRNSLLGTRKKNSQILNEDFYLPLYLPLWVSGMSWFQLQRKAWFSLLVFVLCRTWLIHQRITSCRRLKESCTYRKALTLHIVEFLREAQVLSWELLCIWL